VFISYLVTRAIKRHPYLAVGWLWYLGTLVPVIGLVQVGSQSMADRYTYLPLVGIFVMISWGIPALFPRWRLPRCGLAVAGSSVLAIMMVVTWVQAGYWKDNISLFRHALDVTTANSLAHNNLGTALHERGDTQQAAAQYREALRIRPAYPEALVNLGNALALQGKKEEAIDRYREALRIKPVYPEALINLGTALAEQGDAKQAIAQYREALRLKPDMAVAHHNLAFVLDKRGELAEAVREYAEAVRIDPGYAQAHFRLGGGLLRQGRHEEAVGHYAAARRLDAHYAPVASYNIACAYALQGKKEEAVGALRRAVDEGYDNWDLIRTDPELENIWNTSYYGEVMRGR
jgi:tetratricopeptide (TPR) repeat protein